MNSFFIKYHFPNCKTVDTIFKTIFIDVILKISLMGMRPVSVECQLKM